MFDCDDDGRIELNEMHDVLRDSYGIRNMQQIDTNRDGNISGEELRAAIRRGPRRD